MTISVSQIGFGEAGAAFANGGRWKGGARAFDIKTAGPNTSVAKLSEYEEAGVVGCRSISEVVDGSTAILSTVTAAQTLIAATDAAQHLTSGAYYFDMNSVAPDTKRDAWKAVEARGGLYVDVAIMAPVLPQRLAVPLLLSGDHAHAGANVLRALGFSNVTVIPGEVGRASSVKMLRSVIVKGIEALCAECVMAAQKAGVVSEVLDSLGSEWSDKVDYNLDRMMVHGLRRADEMEEVVKTLVSLGVDPLMTRATVDRQRLIGGLGVDPIPHGLVLKLKRLAAA